MAGCQETNSLVLLTEKQEQRVSFLHIVWLEVSSLLARQLSTDSVLTALKPRNSTLRIPMEKLPYFSFSGTISILCFPYTLHIYFSELLALANARQNWRSVFRKIDG
jgi:hypothetical protein